MAPSGVDSMSGIRAVRASQDLAHSGLPWLAQRVFVPLSWPLTAIAGSLGISPNATTAIRAILAVLALVLIPFTLWGVVVFLFAVVLDYVDGALARLQDRATYYGKFIDGLVDIVADIFFLPVLGLYLLLNGGPIWSAPVAMLGGLALATGFIALYRLPLFELQAGVQTGIAKGRFLWAVDLFGFNVLFNVRYLTLPIVVLDPALYVAIFSALYVAIAVLVLMSRIARARNGLNIHRRSRSAIKEPG